MSKKNLPFKLELSFSRVNGKIKLNLKFSLKRDGKIIPLSQEKMEHLLCKVNSLPLLSEKRIKPNKQNPYGLVRQIFEVNEETLNTL
jgi:hypothetical protein